MSSDRTGHRPIARTRNLAFHLVTFVFVLLLLEAFAFATYFVTDDLYDHRDSVLERIEPGELETNRAKVDPVLGWDERGPAVSFQRNCLGVEIEFAVDEAGARTYPGYDGRNARVLVVGDSYTRGDDSSGADSYPARLAELLKVSVANLGVGGYGPAQSFLRLEQKLGLYPDAEVVVLGIMYENVYRMVNSYRPVLYDKSQPFAFKPYMSQGKIVSHPGPAAFEDVDRLRSFASRAFDGDFWSKPRHEFPYTLSLTRALTSNFFYFRKFQKIFRNLGFPEYFLTFQSEAIEPQLFGLLDLYAQFAGERGLTPVVVFIPRNRLDIRSLSEMLAASARSLDPELIVGDVATADVDWERFNLVDREKDNICHPSPYGYRKIAEFVAELLRSRAPNRLAGSSRDELKSEPERIPMVRAESSS